MVTFKMTATVLSGAILAACAQSSPYQAALDEERRAGRIVCEYEKPINSNIRRKTCRLVQDLTRAEKEGVLRTFEHRPDMNNNRGILGRPGRAH
jgi:invasion protein IalB